MPHGNDAELWRSRNQQLTVQVLLAIVMLQSMPKLRWTLAAVLVTVPICCHLCSHEPLEEPNTYQGS